MEAQNSKPNFHWSLIVGEFRVGRDFLLSKPDASPWIAAKAADSVLRGVAQVCFADSPVAGVLITVGVGLARWECAVGCLLGPFVALLTCFGLGQSREMVYNGLFLYNACLLGTVIPALYESLYGGTNDFNMWIMLIVISSMSIPIQVGTMRLLSGVTAEYQTEVGERYSRGLAVLTLPFNLCANIALLSLKAAHSSEAPVPSAADVNVTTVTDPAKGVDWYSVAEGCVLSAGQVYGVDTLAGSVVILVGLAVYSPLLSLASFGGGAVGTVSAVYFAALSRTAVYSGVWGFSPFLTAGALAKTFFRPSARTFVLAIMACLFTVGVQAAWTQTLTSIGINHFTMPFVVTTWLFMLISSENGDIKRI